ncbi:tyrosine-type recombinase/integrase [Paenibacillus silviterrae]|uniref:tyrosine-type recombinase/integrase n=1 Tax=Paenibacillus silviterrae TaxID=3242194 RepID=UPI0025428C39|nr:tyrosine-type recombinase/integrase [Paenibacillus chinjuensis]
MGIKDRREIEANVYPHRFRHTYACQLLDNGAPLDFIQGMLGHEKASTTQIYAQLRGERRRTLSSVILASFCFGVTMKVQLLKRRQRAWGAN